MTDSVRSGTPRENSYFRKGCNPYAETGRSKLQSHRVSLNQQIIKAMRLRTGAENLLRECLCFPLIPLGLKETKDVDFVVPLKDFIQEHYSENPAEYEDQILDLMDLRQAVRTPSRSEAGVELLSSYYTQLGFLETRFFLSSRHPGLFFTWYDSMTGLPACQQHLSMEKASVLFNMAALLTQIAARADRCSPAGLHCSMTALQRAAGVLTQLRETYTHTPSFDLSPAMQTMLVGLMLAQARECFFEKAVLAGTINQFCSLLRLAQEAAWLSDTYALVNQSIAQAPIKEHVPAAWCHTVQVKQQHYQALAHYLVSIALLDHQLNPGDDTDQQDKTMSELYTVMPEELPPLNILRSRKHRQRLGKAHLRSAIKGHEEALRVQSLCKSLKKIDIFQEILRVSHKRSLTKYTELEQEDDFDLMNGPNIIGKTSQQIEIIQPQVSSAKVVDLFQKLGPPAAFSARQKWTAPRKIRLQPGDWEQGFTLRDDAAVQVTGLDPSCAAAGFGLKDGDIIVKVAGKDCKWSSRSEVMNLLQNMPVDGVDIQVVSPQGLEPAQLPKSATLSVGLSKTYSLSCWALDEGKNMKGKKVSKKLSFLSWGSKNTKKAASTVCLPLAVDGSRHPASSSDAPFSNLPDWSSLY
ncbi:rhophilin-2 isoform X2 [Narcine bancroftii]|uniref:rhophilin-2 isoform X2 n=1 Tax=Narcine bancroftii TaxID=1343680 RepID=UPI0038323381